MSRKRKKKEENLLEVNDKCFSYLNSWAEVLKVYESFISITFEFPPRWEHICRQLGDQIQFQNDKEAAEDLNKKRYRKDGCYLLFLGESETFSEYWKILLFLPTM